MLKVGAILVCVSVGLLIILSATTPVQARPQAAGTFTVDRIDDTAAAAAQVCSGASNDCSLRGAIIKANANPGSTVILLSGNVYTLTINPSGGNDATTGDLNLTSNITVTSVCLFPSCVSNATIKGNTGWIDRIFDITATAKISNLTIRNGNMNDNGGGLLIRTGAKVTLNNLTIMTNTGNYGGGIYNDGWLTITNSSILSNTSNQDGGGIYNDNRLWLFNTNLIKNNVALYGQAGGIFNSSYGIIEGSDDLTIEGNVTYGALGHGGGIRNNSGGKITLSNATFRYNRTTHYHGGAIYNEGDLDIRNSVIFSNVSAFFGGGISNNGPMTITNSTISSNRSDKGGGIETSGQTTATLNYVSIVHNTTIWSSTGGGIDTGNSNNIFIHNSIIALNVQSDQKPSDCNGAIRSLGYNLIFTTVHCTISNTVTGNLYGVNPLLGPIQNNGGNTWTYALLPGSPAIDTADPSCSGVFSDQRGVVRPKNGNGLEFAWCDIGAYEYNGPTVQRFYLPMTLQQY